MICRAFVFHFSTAHWFSVFLIFIAVNTIIVVNTYVNSQSTRMPMSRPCRPPGSPVARECEGGDGVGFGGKHCLRRMLRFTSNDERQSCCRSLLWMMLTVCVFLRRPCRPLGCPVERICEGGGGAGFRASKYSCCMCTPFCFRIRQPWVCRVFSVPCLVNVMCFAASSVSSAWLSRNAGVRGGGRGGLQR